MFAHCPYLQRPYVRGNVLCRADWLSPRVVAGCECTILPQSETILPSEQRCRNDVEAHLCKFSWLVLPNSRLPSACGGSNSFFSSISSKCAPRLLYAQCAFGKCNSGQHHLVSAKNARPETLYTCNLLQCLEASELLHIRMAYDDVPSMDAATANGPCRHDGRMGTQIRRALSGAADPADTPVQDLAEGVRKGPVGTIGVVEQSGSRSRKRH